MFDLNLLARDASTGQTFVVGLSSLPSVHNLLEGIKRHVEDKYNLTKAPTAFEFNYKGTYTEAVAWYT